MADIVLTPEQARKFVRALVDTIRTTDPLDKWIDQTELPNEIFSIEADTAWVLPVLRAVVAALDPDGDKPTLPRVTAAELCAAVARGENVSAYVPLILDRLEASSAMEGDLLEAIGEMLATDSPDRPEQCEPERTNGPMEPVAGASALDPPTLKVGERAHVTRWKGDERTVFRIVSIGKMARIVLASVPIGAERSAVRYEVPLSDLRRVEEEKP